MLVPWWVYYDSIQRQFHESKFQPIWSCVPKTPSHGPLPALPTATPTNSTSPLLLLRYSWDYPKHQVQSWYPLSQSKLYDHQCSWYWDLLWHPKATWIGNTYPWWLNQPIWKIRVILDHLPQFSGWKIQKIVGKTHHRVSYSTLMCNGVWPLKFCTLGSAFCSKMYLVNVICLTLLKTGLQCT